MFLSVALFVFVRFFIELLSNEYVAKSSTCQMLLDKAIAETLPDIRSAYFLKAVHADNRAVAETFAKYNLGFLAQNSTYPSETHIIENACKISYVTGEFLSWTAGVTPLFVVWVVFLIWKKIRPRKMQHVEIELPETPITPELDKPPRTPVYKPNQQEYETEYQSNRDKGATQMMNAGIRRRKERRKKTEGVLQKITSLSPSLKSRIMNSEV